MSESSKQNPKFRLIDFGTPEQVEATKLKEFNQLTTQQRLDLYMQQIAELHNFSEIRLDRRLTRFVILD